MDKQNRPKRDEHEPHADAPYDATEPERIRDLEEPEPAPRDEDEFVTDAELEARELDRPTDEA